MDVVLNEKCFGDFLVLIHELTGITIGKNRTSMVEGRLRKRVSALNLSSYEEYLRLVRQDKNEQVSFIDLVTTNETSFFRTSRIWDYLETKFLPNWIAEHPKQVFTAWSAAASSGEEAHSLGILCQSFKDRHPNFLYQIVGTDISEEMVGLCRAGTYSGRSIDTFRKTKPQLFERFMKPCADGQFRLAPEIKSRLRFLPHNLFQPFPTADQFDLVLLRNVLIYFTGKDQEQVLSLIEPRLAEKGVLIIGESESLTHINTQFKSVEPLVYTAKNNPSAVPKAG